MTSPLSAFSTKWHPASVVLITNFPIRSHPFSSPLPVRRSYLVQSATFVLFGRLNVGLKVTRRYRSVFRFSGSSQSSSSILARIHGLGRRFRTRKTHDLALCCCTCHALGKIDADSCPNREFVPDSRGATETLLKQMGARRVRARMPTTVGRGARGSEAVAGRSCPQGPREFANLRARRAVR